MAVNPNKTHTRTMSQTDVDMVKDWLDSGASANALTQVYGVSRLIITQIGAGQVTVGVGPNIGPQPGRFVDFKGFDEADSVYSVFSVTNSTPIEILTEERRIILPNGDVVTAEHASLYFRDLLHAQQAKMEVFIDLENEGCDVLYLPFPRSEMFATEALWDRDHDFTKESSLMDKILHLANDARIRNEDIQQRNLEYRNQL